MSRTSYVEERASDESVTHTIEHDKVVEDEKSIELAVAGIDAPRPVRAHYHKVPSTVPESAGQRRGQNDRDRSTEGIEILLLHRERADATGVLQTAEAQEQNRRDGHRESHCGQRVPVAVNQL